MLRIDSSNIEDSHSEGAVGQIRSQPDHDRVGGGCLEVGVRLGHGNGSAKVQRVETTRQPQIR